MNFSERLLLLEKLEKKLVANQQATAIKEVSTTKKTEHGGS